MKPFRDYKSSSYFSRFQVKYRRRRGGKTDYRARLRLIKQSKSKNDSSKFRLVVRYSNKSICCEVVNALMVGDRTVSHAHSHELVNFGVKVGLSNYPAAYCVGLLCARRCLEKFSQVCSPSEQTSGNHNLRETKTPGNPFTAVLDAGLKRTSTGSKVFAALKGAVDGGLSIPHNEKRFVGYDSVAKTYNSELMDKYIFGGHISEFMDDLQTEEPDGFARQFSKYISYNISSGDLRQLYEQAHKSILENPNKVSTPRQESMPPGQQVGSLTSHRRSPKPSQTTKLSSEHRKNRLFEKRALLMSTGTLTRSE